MDFSLNEAKQRLLNPKCEHRRVAPEKLNPGMPSVEDLEQNHFLTTFSLREGGWEEGCCGTE